MEDTFYAGRWWRASAYEIRGDYIVPVPGATFSAFEPLDDFQDARSNRGEVESPYLSLINLADRITYGADHALTQDSRDRILAWCNAHGLLGLLLHQVQQASFAPRWQRRHPRQVTEEDRQREASLREQLASSDDPEMRAIAAQLARPESSKEKLFPTWVTYSRANWGMLHWGQFQIVTQTIDFDPEMEGKVLDRSEWDEEAGRVLVCDATSQKWYFQSLNGIWRRHFPFVPTTERETYPYPQPYTDEFWRLYGEPIVDFLVAARQLRSAFLAAAAFKQNTPETQGIAPDLSRLNCLVAPVGPCILRMRNGDIEQRSVATSMFGALAIMAQQDLATDRRVIRCQNKTCGLVVVAAGYQTKYCSTRCRHAAEKREQRARAKRSTPPASAPRGGASKPAGKGRKLR